MAATTEHSDTNSGRRLKQGDAEAENGRADDHKQYWLGHSGDNGAKGARLSSIKETSTVEARHDEDDDELLEKIRSIGGGTRFTPSFKAPSMYHTKQEQQGSTSKL